MKIINSQLDSLSVNLLNNNGACELVPSQELYIDLDKFDNQNNVSIEVDNCNKTTKACKKTYERYRTEAEQTEGQKNKHPMIEIHNHHCRLNCAKKISEDCRKIIYNEYWGLGKTRRMWLNRFVEIMNVKSKLTNRTRNRESTIQYYLPNKTQNKDREAVCQKFFLATLGYHHNSIVMTFVKAKTDKTGNHLTEPIMDMRGKREPGNKKDLSTIIDHVNTYKPVQGTNSPDKMYLPASLNVKEMYKCFCEYYPNLLCYEVYRKQVRRMNIHFGNPNEVIKIPEPENEISSFNDPQKCVLETNMPVIVENEKDCQSTTSFQETIEKSSKDLQNHIEIQDNLQNNNVLNENILITDKNESLIIHPTDSNYHQSNETDVNVVKAGCLPIENNKKHPIRPPKNIKIEPFKKPRRRFRYFDAELKLKHPLVPMTEHRCRYECNEKFDLQSRQRIYDLYWSLGLEKRIWLNKYIQICDVKTRLLSSKKIRLNSFFYDLPNEDGTTKRVCQKFFLGTLGYTHSSIVSTFVKAKKDQLGRPLNVPKLDMRGKHIPKNKTNRMVILDHINTFLPLKGKTSKWFYLSPKLSIMDMFRDFCLYHSGKMSYEIYRGVVKKLNFIFVDPEEETELASIDDFIKVIYPKQSRNSLGPFKQDTNLIIKNNEPCLLNESYQVEANIEVNDENGSIQQTNANNKVEFLHVPDAHKVYKSVGPNLARKKQIAAMKEKHQMYTVKGNCCRLNCNTKFTDDLRKPIHDNFWSFDNNERRLWINNYVKVIPVKRQHRNAKTNRQNSAIYSLPFTNGIFCKVCQRFFLSTLGYANSSIISSFIRAKVSKSGERLDLPRIDMRGRRTPNNKIDRTLIVNHIESIRTQDLSIKEMFTDFKRKHRVIISYELYRLEVKKLRNSLIEPIIHINSEINEDGVSKEECLIPLPNDELEESKKCDLEIENNTSSSKLIATQIFESTETPHPILPISSKKCCPNKCNLLFNDEMRLNINNDFWSLSEQDQKLWLDCFINPLIKNNNKTSKKYSVEYCLPQLGGRSECVCRKFFLATLGYVLRTTINKVLRNKIQNKSSRTTDNDPSIENTKQIFEDTNNGTKLIVTRSNNPNQQQSISNSKIDKILFEPMIRVAHEPDKQNETEVCQDSIIVANATNSQPDAPVKESNVGVFEFFDYSSNKETKTINRKTKKAEFIAVVNHLCRQNCQLVSLEVRKIIFNRFWNLPNIDQQNWLRKHIRQTEIKRRLCNRKLNRVNSLIYELPVSKTKNARVCRKFFLATLGYTTTTLITTFIRAHSTGSVKNFNAPKVDINKTKPLSTVEK